MSFGEWFDRARMQVGEYGPIAGGRAATRSLWSGVAHRLSGLGDEPEGTNVYDKDWDVLVVLDACRVDALAAVADEYDFLPSEVGSVYSVASTSEMWLDRTFIAEHRAEISETALVTANSHADGFRSGWFDVDESAFTVFDPVYEYAFESGAGTIRPSAVTDRAIAVNRSRSHERLIVHYMQPHTPYRKLDTDGIGTTGEGDKPFRETAWDLVMAGKLSRSELWELYIDNLCWVLDEVDSLVDNVDADRLVISADHGEAFGEWGAWGHSPTGTFEGLRRVPWVETAATNHGTRDPSIEPPKESGPDVEIEEQLKHLGYR